MFGAVKVEGSLTQQPRGARRGTESLEDQHAAVCRVSHIQLLSDREGADWGSNRNLSRLRQAAIRTDAVEILLTENLFCRGRRNRLRLSGPLREWIVAKDTVLPGVENHQLVAHHDDTLRISEHVLGCRKRLIRGLDPYTDDSNRRLCVEVRRREDNNPGVGIDHIEAAFVIDRDAGRRVQNRFIQTLFGRLADGAVLVLKIRLAENEIGGRAIPASVKRRPRIAHNTVVQRVREP